MFMANRAARWFFVSALAMFLMILTGCAVRGPASAPPSDIQRSWDGTWAMNEQGGFMSFQDCCQGPAENIPLTPKYRKLRDDFAAIPWESAESSRMNIGSNLARCITPGIPGIFTHPMLFEFTWGPGRVNIVYQDGSFRRIWTDGRTFPERLLPSRMGMSIGHWEGSTLVAETRGISRQSEIFMLGPVRPSPQTKVTERIMVKEGAIVAIDIPGDSENPTIPVKKYLHLQATIEDPEIFLVPYTIDRFFVPVPISFETGCAANNRDNGLRDVDLTPPEDD